MVMPHPTLAPRAVVTALPSYKVGRSAAEVAAEHGPSEAIKLASNELPYGPLPSVLEAMAAAVADCHHYPDMGCAPIRNAISNDMGISPSMLTVGAGSSGLLQGLAFAFCGHGDEIVYPWRSFEAYPIMSIQTGATPVTVPLKRQAFDLEAVACAITERTRLVYLPNPNNPTGTAFGTAEFETFLEQVPSNVLVVLDEAYTEFATRTDLPRGLDYALSQPNVCVTRTFSKAYGLAGLRLGYLVGHPIVVDALDKVRIPFSVNAVAQAAGVACVAASEELAERVNDVVSERARVEAAIREMGLGLPDPQGNFVWLAAGAAADLVATGLEARGIGGRAFSGEGVRVTIGTQQENDQFLVALAQVVGTEGAEVSKEWQLPTGQEARSTGHLLTTIDAIADRLADLACDHRSGTVEGSSDDEIGNGDGPMDEARLWTHLAANTHYWHSRVLAAVDAAADQLVDCQIPLFCDDDSPEHASIEENLSELLAVLGAHRALLAGFSSSDWARRCRQAGTYVSVEELVRCHMLDRIAAEADRLASMKPEDEQL